MDLYEWVNSDRTNKTRCLFVREYVLGYLFNQIVTWAGMRQMNMVETVDQSNEFRYVTTDPPTDRQQQQQKTFSVNWIFVGSFACFQDNQPYSWRVPIYQKN